MSFYCPSNPVENLKYYIFGSQLYRYGKFLIILSNQDFFKLTLQSIVDISSIYTKLTTLFVADIDECSVNSPGMAAACPAESECMNHLLGYDCKCSEGYQYNQKTKACESKFDDEIAIEQAYQNLTMEISRFWFQIKLTHISTH